MYKTTELLDLEKTIAHELFEGKTYPWEVLREIGDFVRNLGVSLPETEYRRVGDDVWIAVDAEVAESACVKGPCIIDKGAEVRHSAFIRGNAIVGKGAVVGNSTEVKNSVLFDKAQVPHFNYVGDSVLGYKSHMGAGCICSNVKGDKSTVSVRSGNTLIDTGLKKFGTVLGDNCEIGCNSVLNPGSVIGRDSMVYPLSSVRGLVAERSVYKNRNEIIDKV